MTKCLCKHRRKRHGAYGQCCVQGCFCRFFTTRFKSNFEETIWKDFKWCYSERIQYRGESWQKEGVIRSLKDENARLQKWLIESNADKSKWESTARGTVGIVLAHMQQHGHWDKSVSCDLCRQSEAILKSLGFVLQNNLPVVTKEPWK